MIPDPLVCWGLARLLSDSPINGELDAVAGPYRRLLDYLTGLPTGERLGAFNGFLMRETSEEEAAVIKAVAGQNPKGLPPLVATGPRFATAADVRRIQANIRWTCEGWIPAARVVGVAAPEGAGKTRFGLDLCRRVWHGLPWHDGQAMTLPLRTPSLWLCSDGQHDEIIDTLPAFGLPDESIVFPAPPDHPYDNIDLDLPETRKWLEDAIATVRPWCLFIDSLTNATTLDLCEQSSVAKLKSPLVDWVQAYHINIILLLHVSLQGQALGRRIKGITRTLMHLEAPDPTRPERLRLWMEKTYGKRPPPLGVTMEGSGNVYDFNPPAPRDLSRSGRPPDKRGKAAQFIRDALARNNDQVGNDLCREWEKTGGNDTTFWRAVDGMKDDGDLTADGGRGTGKQTVLHLNSLKTPKP